MQNLTPNISIIVPVFNVEKYLRFCIDSVIKQTYTNFELLLINDGSSDNSGSICDEYAEKDDRIRVFHGDNRGVSHARNIGITNAIGNWITFIDSDDYIEASLLSVYMKQINEEVDLIVMGYINEYDNHSEPITIGNNKKCSMTQGLAYCQISKYYGYVWNRLYKRSIISKNRLTFDVNLSYCEDHYFSYCYSYYCNNILLLKDTLYHHRILKESLSTKYSLNSVIDIYHRERYIFSNILKENPDKTLKNVVKGIYRYRITDSLSIIYKKRHGKLSAKERALYISKLLQTNRFYAAVIDYILLFAYSIRKIIS